MALYNLALENELKEDFNKYWSDLGVVSGQYHHVQVALSYDFLNLPESMRWGVIVDYLDGIGIKCSVEYLAAGEGEYWSLVQVKKKGWRCVHETQDDTLSSSRESIIRYLNQNYSEIKKEHLS